MTLSAYQKPMKASQPLPASELPHHGIRFLTQPHSHRREPVHGMALTMFRNSFNVNARSVSVVTLPLLASVRIACAALSSSGNSAMTRPPYCPIVTKNYFPVPPMDSTLAFACSVWLGLSRICVSSRGNVLTTTFGGAVLRTAINQTDSAITSIMRLVFPRLV